MISIGYSKSTQNTKAFALVVEGWNELVQEGMTLDQISFPYAATDAEVLFADLHNETVGCLLWRHSAGTQTFHVTMAYVEPSSRKKGVFKELVQSLKKLAKQRQVTRISFEFGAGNDVAEDVMEAIGARLSSVVYEM
ncbi:MAG: GNAT family N-acetyltransferase [Aquamicrobium sp.]|uniref:GNAT family N-acetyltransferase n=1 Tax=Aquamicrobium sp. TaxID=1872579 RepID=UPI00349EAAB2|nr:GNAT family N-acetyltransferase [Aquamicrobium sp.]